MKLGIIDYQLPRGGVERFVLGVLGSLPPEVEVTIFTTGWALSGYQGLIAQTARPVRLADVPITTHHVAMATNGQASLGAEQVFDIPASLWSEIDLAWFPWVNRHLIPRACQIRTVATVHDMIGVELGEFMATKRDPLGRVGAIYAMGMEDLLTRQLCGSLAKIVTDTQRTADHLVRTYGPMARRPDVIYPSVEHMTEFAAEPIDGLGLPPRYLIYPSSYYPHKNHELLFMALAKVKAEAPAAFLPLVLSGWRTDLIASGGDYRGAYLKALLDHLKLEIGRDLILPGRVSDGQFRSILAGAAGMVFPTLQEGFGFPPVEAAYLGVPLAVSDIEIMRESLKRFEVPALWFRPDSVEEVAAALIRLASDEPALRAQAAASIPALGAESWADVGIRYAAAFEEQLSIASMYGKYNG